MITSIRLRSAAGAAIVALSAGAAAQTPTARPAAARASSATAASSDALFAQARSLIDNGRFDAAIARLDEMTRRLGAVSPDVAAREKLDAALYWKAYSQSRLGERAEALSTITDMEQRFGGSAWLKDARALELEIRQASGQAISPDAQPDDELKLLALRGLMQSDPDRALPMVEQILAGDSSIKVKENALFVLSQSRSAKARQMLADAAKGATNPDLQLRAVRYLGAMGGPDNLQTLDEVYRGSSSTEVKRAVLRSFMVASDHARLVSVAKSESSPDLRQTAIQQLGAMRANTELSELYQSVTDADLKRRIIQALFVGGASDKLIELARTEANADLKRSAIRNLGLMSADQTADTLNAIYASSTDRGIKEEVVNALFLQKNAASLVELARTETDPDLKKHIVSRLTRMKSPEATDYFLGLLK
jgi:hypothetical protein